MTEDEKKNQKQKSGRKKPFSCSQLLPFGVGATICDCIAKMPLPFPCARKKLGANLSEAEIELLVAQAMGFLHIDNTVKAAELMLDCATTSITMAPPLPSSTPPTTELAEMAASNAVVEGAVSAKSIGTVIVIGGTGVVVGGSVLVYILLSPVNNIINTHKPTPSPSPYPT
eukprot:scaffold45010_cov37-Attheya_sp.AAC.1